jgi:hypothetical protein
MVDNNKNVGTIRDLKGSTEALGSGESIEPFGSRTNVCKVMLITSNIISAGAIVLDAKSVMATKRYFKNDTNVKG